MYRTGALVVRSLVLVEVGCEVRLYLPLDIRCVFFFFQAEDGIRDWSVTGVQTCALPISRESPPRRAPRARRPAPRRQEVHLGPERRPCPRDDRDTPPTDPRGPLCPCRRTRSLRTSAGNASSGSSTTSGRTSIGSAGS